MKILPREKILFFTTIGVGICALFYVFILEPWLVRWRDIESQLSSKEERLSSALKTIKAARGIEGPLMGVSINDMASLLEGIDRLATAAGVSLASIEPLRVEEKGTFQLLRVRVNGEGDSYSLTNLLSGLKNEGLSVERLEVLSESSDRLVLHLLVASLAFKDQPARELDLKGVELTLDPYYLPIVERGIFGPIIEDEPVEVKESEIIVKEPVVKDLLLKGVIFDGSKFLAVLEDKLTQNSLTIGEGDLIKGVKVLKIHSNGVILEEDGAQFCLTLR